MIKTNRKDYDLFVSLGGSCNAAGQIKSRGLRKFALPFDWIGTFAAENLHNFRKGLDTHFKDWCRYENMREYGEVRMELGKPTYMFEDTASGYHFIHQFHAPLKDRAAFDRARKTWEKRVERFYSRVAASRNVLFVLTTLLPFDFSVAEEILVALRKTFPGVNCELAVMQFAAPEHVCVELCDGAIHMETFTRQVDKVYDNYLSSTEWGWLDTLSLSGEAEPRGFKKLFMKWKYKLWKALGNSLLRDGISKGRVQFCEIERGAMALADG